MITFLIVGLIAGWLASVIMKTNASQGMLMDLVFGVVGAFIGGFIMNMMGQPGVSGFNLYSILVATLGAAIAIWIGRRLKR